MDVEQLAPMQVDVEDDDASAFEPVEVWPEHWDAVRLFKACQDHWVVLVGFGATYYQALDMKQVDVVRDWMSIDKSERLLEQLQVMTGEAKKHLNR